ncbi:MAG: TRAP transporter fused permease subunit [Siculibacillus sp.]|nr:TRAP transporter fused permease subunit [Siculibacillus sp.]
MTATTNSPSALDTFEHGFPTGFGKGRPALVAFSIALLFSAFQIFVSAWPILPSLAVRGIHVGFLLLLSFGLIANFRSRSRLELASGWALGVLGFAIGLYQWIEHDALILRAGDLERRDLVVGVLLIVLVFEACRRLMGPALPIMCGVCLLYAFGGQWFPGPLATRGYGFDQVIDQMSFGTEGIYGVPVNVSATYIFLFILFGSFLEKAGMIHLFTDVSLGLFGRARGGPAKVAVFSSGLMGTISGSGVANVVTVGQFTIPLMIRFGYRRAFAAGVEATASMGGQIMPPVMGAAAFIMAETLDVPYSAIVTAAVLPAILYFASAYWMVHLEAGKHGLSGMTEVPSALVALKARWYLALPLAALIFMLFHGFTPLFAGTLGLALTVVLILGASAAVGLPATWMRVVFWIGLGLVAASFLKFGLTPVVVVIAVLAVVLLFSRGGRETLLLCRDSFADSAKTALSVGVACAIVGTIIGTFTLTGLGTTFGTWVVGIGKESLFLSLVLTMILSIVLGTGIPTIPTYIIVAALAAPAMATLGVPLIVSHMFAFYFGIMADLSPPVALAALAAAPIARENPDKIGWEAMRIAGAGYVIPFAAVYAPALMMQSGDPMAVHLGFWGAVVFAFVKTGFAMGLFGAGLIGWLFGPLAVWERAAVLLAAALLVIEFPWSDAAGLVLGAAMVAQHRSRTRHAVVGPAT